MRRRPAAGSWQEARPLTAGTSAAPQALLVVDAAGAALGVWGQLVGSSQELWGRRLVGATLGPAGRLSRPGEPAALPFLVGEREGGALLTWSSAGLWALTIDASGVWSPRRLLSDGVVGAAHGGLDARGRATVVWEAGVGRGTVRGRRFDPLAPASEPPLLEAAGAAGSPCVAVAPGGAALAVWRTQDGGLAYSYAPGP